MTTEAIEAYFLDYISFQKELKSKLEYKASSKISPDTFLYKAFKFFDLYNNGYLNRTDFFKAIAKCGVVLDTHDMEAVFNHYNTHDDGNIHYKEFIEKLLFSEPDSEENSLQMSQSQYSQQGKKQFNPESSRVIQSAHQKQNLKYQRSANFGQQDSLSYSQGSLKQSKINNLYQNCQTYTETQDSVKKLLRTQGLASLLQFAVNLKSRDISKTHKINKQNLAQELREIPEKGINQILEQFNADQYSQINYAQFIYALKGQLQLNQQKVIEKIFNFLSQSNAEGQVQIQKIINAFHDMRQAQQFRKAIDLYCQFQAIDDGIFTDEDFLDFFGFLAFSFCDPYQFITFVQRAFFDQDAKSNISQRSNRSRQFRNQPIQHRQQNNYQLESDFRKNKEPKQTQPLKNNFVQQSPSDRFKKSQKAHQQQGQNKYDANKSSRFSQVEKKSSTTSIYIKQVQLIVSRIKKRLASKGTRGYLIFEKSLRNVSGENDDLVNLEGLRKVVRDLRIDITTNECNLLFDVFDPEGTHYISYEELVYTIKGQIPENRKQLFERVWNTIKLNEQLTTFSNIKHCLNFRGHPDIQTGRRYDDDVWRQIQETLLLIQELNNTPRNEQVTKKQFEEYFQNLSLSISQDQLFETTLQNFWKMQSKLNIHDMYAGSRKLFDPTKKGYLVDHHRHTVQGGSISSNAPFGTSSEPTNYATEHGRL